jgi:hypothetical protein
MPARICVNIGKLQIMLQNRLKFGLCVCMATCCLLLTNVCSAAKLFIPMDAETQTNHLKAYGIAYAAMKEGIPVDWLLNYKGGSFAMDQADDIERM